ncbi:AraC family transcriptional regulator [Shouchella sp. JSM 1781072]|uniref:AraC family transcriptional regulator n=1 Tax=Bacillaceae TaxID=186817 RepID=UPI000C083C9B|nr:MULTISPECIES: AraC family transcriptional regulator [Bacillaceae]UTR05814.1 AraC family transcriptional regulator [Alkalihalobacillus sp. LMS6]
MDDKSSFIRGSHSFTFQFLPETGLLSLWNIGWEVRTDPSYYWDGRTRLVDHNTLIFQYTISGKGILEINNQTYTINQHEAFIISVPGNHRYYYPKDATEPWEFIYIALQGPTVEDISTRLTKETGPIVELSPDSYLIRSLFSIYNETKADRLRDPYQAAAHGYQFLLECFRTLHTNTPKGDSYYYQQAFAYIESNFHKQISLDDVAEQIGVSRYSLTRLFKKQTGATPMEFVRELRIRKACAMLIHTSRPIKDISCEVGFLDVNYFHKVFKRYTGSNASFFRKKGDFSQIYLRKTKGE